MYNSQDTRQFLICQLDVHLLVPTSYGGFVQSLTVDFDKTRVWLKFGQ